jgi:tRNA uridine 5-carboxymethylaminomethyl modification enzyme
MRLTPLATAIGCVLPDRQRRFDDYVAATDAGREMLRSLTLTPTEARRAGLKLNLDGQRRSAYELLSYPEYNIERLQGVWPQLSNIEVKVGNSLEIEATYSVYMQRQSADIAEVRRDEDRAIPDDFDFEIMSGLSNELKQKLKTFRPSNVAQAAKLDGMTPAALSLLLVHLRRNKSDILQSA